MVPSIFDGLQHALAQPDHRTTKFSSSYISCNYLRLLTQLSASSEICADKLVEKKIFPILDTALQSDPNKFYFDVFRAADCLWHILQASENKHAEAVRQITSITSRM